MTKEELKTLVFEDNKQTGYIEETYEILTCGKILTYHNYEDFEKLAIMLDKDNQFNVTYIQRLFNFNMDKIIVKLWVDMKAR